MTVADFIQAISVLAASWAIIAGINAWKREFIGKRKIELAEAVLAKFFEVSDAIAFIRSPWSSNDEGKSRKRASDEFEEESKLLDRAYIVHERYERKAEIFSEFQVLKYKVMASFGKEASEIFERTNHVLTRIFVSAQALGTHYWQRQGRAEMEPDEFKRHLEEKRQHESIFWDRYKENDEIRDELAQVLAKLESLTKPCFEEASSLYSILTKKLIRG